jgi:colanic acid biosynthesis glycosyl transferase WcaI
MIPGTRILIIGINYTPERTGIGRYTGEMGAWLSAQGAEVQVVTGFPYYPEWKVSPSYLAKWFSRESLAGASILRCPLYVPTHPTPVRRMLQDLSFLLTSLIGVSGLMLRGRRYDQIWVASPSFLSGWVGLWAGIFSRHAHRQLHVFDLQVDAARGLGMIRAGGLLRILSGMESAMMKRYDGVSTLSEGMLERIAAKHINRERLRLLPIWVDPSRFQPLEVALDLHDRLGIPVGRRLVLYSGAVGEKQGLEQLLALAALAESAGRSDLIFVIAGEGPYVRKLKKEAKDAGLGNLLFIPLQDDDVFPSLLNAAWLHLILQRDTGNDHFMPSKLYPILSVGGLAMVTAQPGTSLGKLIAEHQIAALVPENKADALLGMLIELLVNQDKCMVLRMNARKYTLEYLSSDRLLTAYWEQSMKNTLTV